MNYSIIILIVGILFIGSIFGLVYDSTILQPYRDCELLSNEGYDIKVVWHKQFIFGDNQCWVKFGNNYVPMEKWLIIKEGGSE